MKNLLYFVILSVIPASISAQDINFYEDTTANLIGLDRSSSDLGDVDGDGDLDLLIIGNDATDNRVATLYENDGLGNFTILSDSSFEKVSQGTVDFADIDNDGDLDVLITGNNDTDIPTSILYENDGTGSYTQLNTSALIGTRLSAAEFGDVDGDNDLDLLITGNPGVMAFYLNDGTGVFTQDASVPFISVQQSAVRFFDMDGDNDLDIVMSGSQWGGAGLASGLYENDGSGNFIDVTPSFMDPVKSCDIGISDIDNDNDLDLLIIGSINSLVYHSELYINDGTGAFTVAFSHPFEPMDLCSIQFADYDTDGDEDAIVIGRTLALTQSYIYKNDGSGNFTNQLDSIIIPLIEYGAIAAGDLNNNGQIDLVVSGRHDWFPAWDHYTKVYFNDSPNDVSEAEFDWYVSCSPNPASFVCNLHINSIKGGDANLFINGLNGELVKTQRIGRIEIGKTSIDIDVSNMSQGLYIYTVVVDNEPINGKLNVIR